MFFPVLYLLTSLPLKLKELLNICLYLGNKKTIIVGFGPAGMYASLRLIELGIKPIVFERGKDVRSRRRDLSSDSTV